MMLTLKDACRCLYRSGCAICLFFLELMRLLKHNKNTDIHFPSNPPRSSRNSLIPGLCWLLWKPGQRTTSSTSTTTPWWPWGSSWSTGRTSSRRNATLFTSSRESERLRGFSCPIRCSASFLMELMHFLVSSEGIAFTAAGAELPTWEEFALWLKEAEWMRWVSDNSPKPVSISKSNHSQLSITRRVITHCKYFYFTSCVTASINIITLKGDASVSSFVLLRLI